MLAALRVIHVDTSASAGQRLVGDITYLRTGEGWCYLATVIDLCTRMVVGWAMAALTRTSLSLTPWTWPGPAGTCRLGRSSTRTAELTTTHRLNPEFRSWWTVGGFVRAGFVLSGA